MADDFDPDKYLAEKTASAAFDPDKYLAEKTNPALPVSAEPSLLSKIGTGVGKWASDSAGRFKDEYVKPVTDAFSLDKALPVAKGIPFLGEAAERGGAALGATVATNVYPRAGTYEENFNRLLGDQHKREGAYEAANPKASTALQMAAGGTMPIAPEMKASMDAGRLARVGVGAVNAASRIGTNAALSAGDAYEKGQDPGKAALEGGILAGGLEGAGSLAGAAKGQLARGQVDADRLSAYLKDLAEKKAFKAAVGNQAKPYAEAAAKGQINDRGRELLDSGVVKFGGSAQGIADRAKVEKGKAWDEMKGILQKGDEQLAAPVEKIAVGGSIPLDAEHSLVLQRATPGRLKNGPKSSDKWNVIRNDAPDKPLGDGFQITSYDAPEGPYAAVFRSDLGEGAGKGLGTKAYKALSGQYGTLVSGAESTSAPAQRVWEKVGGKDIPAARFEGSGDLTENAAGWPRKMLDAEKTGGVSGQEIADAIRTTRAKIAGKGNESTIKALDDAAEHYESMGKNIPFDQSQIEKNSWQYKPGADFKVNNIVKGAIGDAMETGVGRIGLGAEYGDAKSRYGTMTAAVKDAQVNANRYAKNNSASLGDKFAAGGAAMIAPGSGLIKGAAGLAAGAANKLIRKRGASALAVGADKAADLLKNSPEALGNFAGLLRDAQQRGSLPLVHQLLMQKPEYRQIMEGDQQ